MNAYSVFSDLKQPRPSTGQAPVFLDDAEKPVRLSPILDGDALPPGFEDVLEVQVLGYRDRLAMVRGRRRRVLDPVWTLVPRDR